jgi:sortase (surface protein transpeptidase)
MRRLLVLILALLITGCGATAPAPPPPAPVVETAVAEPAAIRIPGIGVDAVVVGVGLQTDGAMETPDFGLAGWYREGPRPGEAGPAVVVAHVDSRSGPDVFHRLRELQPGAEVVVRDGAGAEHAFAVERVEQVDKDALPAEQIWSASDKPLLRLITCGGAFDRSTRHYLDNVIVYARAL